METSDMKATTMFDTGYNSVQLYDASAATFSPTCPLAKLSGGHLRLLDANVSILDLDPTTGRKPIDVIFGKIQKKFVIVNPRQFLTFTSAMLQLVAFKSAGLKPPDEFVRILSSIRFSCTPRSIEEIETDILGERISETYLLKLSFSYLVVETDIIMNRNSLMPLETEFALLGNKGFSMY